MDTIQLIHIAMAVLAVCIGAIVFYIDRLMKTGSEVASYKQLKFMRNFGIFTLAASLLMILNYSLTS